MKKVLLTLVVMLLLGATNAYAAPAQMNLVDLFDWGRLYGFDGTNWNPSNSNPYDSTAGTSMVAGTTGNVDTQEDSWGIAQVDEILLQPGGTSIFDKELSGSPEITVFFWGFDDDYIAVPDPVSNVTTIGSKGGHVEVWIGSPQDYNVPGNKGALGTGGRSDGTDPSHYDTVTDDGTLLLDLMPVAQNASNHTLVSTFNFNSLAGSGSVYLNAVGGAWASAYDTNSQLFGSDFLFSYNVVANQGPQIGDWTVKGSGNVYGDLIPEPASMSIFGMGIFGLVGALRRKKRVC